MMKGFISRKLAALGAVILLAVGGSAHATLITFSFQGTIDQADSGIAPTFAVGQTITVNYTFDSTVPARDGSTSTFSVFDALTDFSFSNGTYSASSSGAPEIQVDNDPGSPDNDRYGLTVRSSDGLTGSSINGFTLDTFLFRLDDVTNSVFSDALTLPLSLDLADFSSSAFFIFFSDPNVVPSSIGINAISPTQLVSGTFTSLTVSVDNPVVPEPTSLVLGAMGLAMLAAKRRMRRA